MSKFIPLSKDSHVAIVDDADYENVIRFKWACVVSCNKPGGLRSYYASMFISPKVLGLAPWLIDYPSTNIPMHRFLFWPFDQDLIPDHINHDGLDNQRENLRLITKAQNNCNRRMNKDNRSPFKGLWKSGDKWVANIQYQYKRYKLGTFVDPVEAALAYDRKARELFGEFACLNFPQAQG